MELDDYPLLNEPNVMLMALKAATSGRVAPERCVERLLEHLKRIGSGIPESPEPLRRRVAMVFQYLAVAGLLDPDEEGLYTITDRGRRMLEQYPAGLDSSVLVAFPEFRSYLRGRRTTWEEDEGIGRPVEPKPAYDEGYAAFLQGLGLTDNPNPSDSIDHLEWENGWSEARDEHLA